MTIKLPKDDPWYDPLEPFELPDAPDLAPLGVTGVHGLREFVSEAVSKQPHTRESRSVNGCFLNRLESGMYELLIPQNRGSYLRTQGTESEMIALAEQVSYT